jgi:hypothetical protein
MPYASIGGSDTGIVISEGRTLRSCWARRLA